MWPFKEKKPLLQHISAGLPASIQLREQLRGEVQQQQKRWPTNFGEEHPFDYSIPQGLYLSMSFVNGVVDKIVNKVWGAGFFTKSESERAKKICDDWMQDVRFDTFGRQWLRQALIKGFSPLELGGRTNEVPQGIKVLNADRVYIQRDTKGVILEIKQLRPGRHPSDKESYIVFQPYQVAILNINQVDDCAYGYGILFPQLNTINNLINAEKDMHKLVHRKANVPIVAYLGDREKGDIPTQEATDDFSEKLQYFNNMTEWAVADNVRVTAVDFGNVAEKFEGVLRHDTDMLFFGFQMPEVIMGRGNIPEGLADTQQEEVDRYVNSMQKEIEKVIEESIFRRILVASGLPNERVQFEWGQPSKRDKAKQIEQITMLLNNPMLHPELQLELQKKLANLLEIPDAIIKSLKALPRPTPTNDTTPEDDERDSEEERSQPIIPGTNKQFCEGELIEYG